MFLVTLLSVSLVNSSDPTAPPILGALNAVEVTILPHDNPQGILTFRQTEYVEWTWGISVREVGLGVREVGLGVREMGLGVREVGLV